MPTDDTIRASDADREHTIGILRDGFVSGRLTLAELHHRTTAALTSRTWGELRQLTRDLPAGAAGRVRSADGRQPRAGGRYLTGARPGSRPQLLPVLLAGVVWLAVTLAVHPSAALIPVVFLMLMAVGAASRVR